MTDTWKVAVHELTPSGHYQMVVQKLESLKPVVPIFDYKGQSNIEEIKFKLAQEEMWKLVMSIVNPKGNPNG